FALEKRQGEARRGTPPSDRRKPWLISSLRETSPDGITKRVADREGRSLGSEASDRANRASFSRRRDPRRPRFEACTRCRQIMQATRVPGERRNAPEERTPLARGTGIVHVSARRSKLEARASRSAKTGSALSRRARLEKGE